MMNIDILSLPGVAAIRDNFIIQLEERLARFETLCYVSMSDQDYAVALDEACAILHKLSGTAGTLGFAELGDKARLCEAGILSHKAGNGPSRQDLLVSLAEFAEMADDLLEQHGRQGGPQPRRRRTGARGLFKKLRPALRLSGSP